MKTSKFLAMALAIALVVSLLPAITMDVLASGGNISENSGPNGEIYNVEGYNKYGYKDETDKGVTVNVTESSKGPYDDVGDTIIYKIEITNETGKDISASKIEMAVYADNNHAVDVFKESGGRLIEFGGKHANGYMFINEILQNPSDALTCFSDFSTSVSGFSSKFNSGVAPTKNDSVLEYNNNFTFKNGGKVTLTVSHKITSDDISKNMHLSNMFILSIGGEDYSIGQYINSEYAAVGDPSKLIVKNDTAESDTFKYTLTSVSTVFNESGLYIKDGVTYTDPHTLTINISGKNSVELDSLPSSDDYIITQTEPTSGDWTTTSGHTEPMESSSVSDPEPAENSRVQSSINVEAAKTTVVKFNNIKAGMSPVPTPTRATYHLNLPSDLGKSGDYVYYDETPTNVLELWEIKEFTNDSDKITGVEFTNVSTDRDSFNSYPNGYLGSNKYYFVGWSTKSGSYSEAGNYNYSDIAYPVTYMAGQKKSSSNTSEVGNGVRGIYGYPSTFNYTTYGNDRGTALFPSAAGAEYYAIWAPKTGSGGDDAKSGLFGYTMQIAGATFPGVDLSASSDNWHITPSDTRLGSNGTGGGGTWQKFAVLDAGHYNGEDESKAMTVEKPQLTVTDSDGTWNFTGWFNKAANTTDDPNEDYFVAPGDKLQYGGDHSVYSLDAIWSRVIKPKDQVVLYNKDGSTPSFDGLSVVLKGGSYKDDGDKKLPRTGWNSIFGDSEEDQVATVTSKNLKYDITISEPESQTLTSQTLSALKDITLTKPGVYTIKVNPKLEDVDTSNKNGGKTDVTIDFGTIEFTYTIIPQLTVNVTKDLQGRTWRSGDSFEFTVTANGTAATDSPITVNEASGHKGSAVVSFKEITEPSGTKPYNITVTENTTGETGMEYATERKIEVTLTKDSDGAYKLSGGDVKLDESTGNYTLDVTMLNKLNTGSLTITKTLEGTASSGHTDDTFTFTVSTVDSTFAGTYDEVEFTGGEATVTITGAGSKTITGLPAGMTFTVEETDSKSANDTTYKVDGETAASASVKIEKDKTSEVEVTNLYANPGSLTISKTVEGANLTKGEHTFDFSIELKKKDGTPLKSSEITLPGGVIEGSPDGTYTFKITANEGKTSPDSVKFENLPYGTQFTINEVKEEHMDHPVAGVNYATVGTPKGTFNVATHSGIIGDGDNMEIKVTNVSPFGKVTIENKVIGVPANKDQTYTYTMTLSGGDHATHYTGAVGNTSFNNGTATFTLKKGEKIDVYLPVNINYTITQSTDKASCGDDWTKLAVTTQKTDSLPASTVSTKGDNGAEGHTVSTSTSSSAGEDSAHTVTFTNYYLADLTIKKNVVGGTATEFGFEVTLTGDELTAPGIGLTHGTTGTENTGSSGKVIFNLNDGGEYTFKNIPTGTKYSVEETNKKDADKTTYTINSGESTETTPTGVVLTANTTVTVTNEYTKTSGGTGGGGGGTGGTGKPSVSIDDHEHYAYIIGMPSGLVEPEDNITRAEIATIIFRLLKEDVRAANWTKANPFPDVNIDNWYNNAVSTLYKMGIVEGRNDGLFHPDDPITRAEMAAMMARLYDYDDDGEFSSKFADVDPHAWYARYVDAAEKLGLFYGYPGDPNFYPNKNLTRAEAMTVYNRLLGRRPHKNHLLPTDQMIMWPDNMDTSAWYYADIQEATNSHTCNIAGATEGGETFEQWLSRLPVRDWSALERAWSEAYSGSDGHDVN